MDETIQEEASKRPAISNGDFLREVSAGASRMWALYGLIAVNLGVFGIMVATGVSPTDPRAESLVEWGANFGPRTAAGQWWRLITYQFVHSGWLHLAVNMYSLLSIGVVCSALIGNAGFLIVYLVTGVFGGITRLYADPHVTSVGASGSVFGIAGCLLLFVTVRMDTFPPAVRRKIMQDMLVFVGLNIYLAFSASGVDHYAHLGGFLSGAICGRILSQPLPFQSAIRMQRNRIVAGLGVGAVALAMMFPPHTVDIAPDIEFIMKRETELLDLHNELAKDVEQGKLTEAEYADRMVRDVLPPWTEARKRGEKLLTAPIGNKPFIGRYVAYLKLREEAWTLEARAIREQSESVLKEAQAKASAADAIVDEMTKTAEPEKPQ